MLLGNCNNKGVHRNWKLDSDCYFSTNFLVLHVFYSREMTSKKDMLVQVLLLQVETIHVLKLYCLKLYQCFSICCKIGWRYMLSIIYYTGHLPTFKGFDFVDITLERNILLFKPVAEPPVCVISLHVCSFFHTTMYVCLPNINFLLKSQYSDNQV